MAVDNRRDRLRELVKQRGFAPLGELADTLAVSESTIRRDLETLEGAGEARRTHGGVYWTGESETINVFKGHHNSNWPAKQSIARLASELIDDHETILLDGGSTVYELARLLLLRKIQVVTNSLPVAHLLSTSDSIDLIMIGGCVRGRTSVTIGPQADAMLSDISVSKAFLSVAGVTQRGFFNSDMMLVESEKAMLKSASQSIVLADHTKFGRVGLSRICQLGEVSMVISDTALPESWKQILRVAGVELRLPERDRRADTDAPDDVLKPSNDRQR